MIFLNLAMKKGKVSHETALTFSKVLAPYAPHLAEELWQLLGNSRTLAYEPWPVYNEEYLKEDNFEYPVSFNGKTRFSILLPVSATKEEVISAVLADERAVRWLDGKTPSNVIVVPNRIVNVVIKN